MNQIERDFSKIACKYINKSNYFKAKFCKTFTFKALDGKIDATAPYPCFYFLCLTRFDIEDRSRQTAFIIKIWYSQSFDFKSSLFTKPQSQMQNDNEKLYAALYKIFSSDQYA